MNVLILGQIEHLLTLFLYQFTFGCWEHYILLKYNLQRCQSGRLCYFRECPAFFITLSRAASEYILAPWKLR